MRNKRRSFLEKLTGNFSIEEEEEQVQDVPVTEDKGTNGENGSEWMEEENEEGQLTVDVFQTPDEIIIKSMVAGVRPDNLSVSITRDMVTIKGRREDDKSIMNDDYYFRELYWGSFSRTILLPEEIDPDHAEAVEKHGLLTIRLPKIDKEKTQNIKVKQG